MDNTVIKREEDEDSWPALDENPEGLAYYLVFYPLKVVFNLAFIVFSPFASPLIPLFVYLLLVPVAGILSLFAGWTIWRSTAVGWETYLDLQYGDDILPYAEVLLPPLVAYQPYDIFLNLAVPATESNLALGNFMTSLTLNSISNKTIAFVRRPAIAVSSGLLPRVSPVLDLRIKLLTAFVPITSIIKARVELGRRDGWRSLGNGEGRELAVIEASLHGTVRYEGLRGLVTRFPLITAAVSSSVFFLISLLMLSICILPTMRWRRVSDVLSEEEVRSDSTDALRRQTAASESEGEDEQVVRARRPTLAARRRRRTRDIKQEDIPLTLLPAGAEPRSLRRRMPLVPEQFSDPDN